jgi:putative spermidine/putrescine transport system ATP-binding protein
VIDKGRIMQLDTPRRIYERPSCRFVAEFVGESAFLPVNVSRGVATLDGVPLKLVEGGEAEDGAMFLMVRPEKLRILSGEQHPGDDMNVLAGRVARFIYQGESFVLDVELASGVTVSVRGMTSSATMASLPKTGEPVRLGLDRNDTFLVPAEERAT